MSGSKLKSKKRSMKNNGQEPFIPAARRSVVMVERSGPVNPPQAVIAQTVGAVPPSSPPKTAGWARIWAWLRGPYPTLFSRLVVGGIFLVFGATKIATTGAFAGEIRAYQMVPAALIQPMAVALPGLAILVGIALLLGIMTRWAAVVAAGLLVMVIVAVWSALARGLAIDCGCVGNIDFAGLADRKETVSPRRIIEDSVSLLLCVHLIVVPTIWAVDQRIRRRVKPLQRSRATGAAGTQSRKKVKR